MKLPILIYIRLIIIMTLGVCIPAIAAVATSDVTPKSLSEGDVAYVLSVCTIVLAMTVVSLFWTMQKKDKILTEITAIHNKDWMRRDELDREDRKRFNDTLNSVIAKCGAR